MRQGKRVVGTIRVRGAQIDEPQLAFLLALGRGIADVATRTALRDAIEESTRERALATERDRIAADLHDSTGQIFVALGLLAHRHAELLPPESELAAQSRRLVELAEQGKWRMVEALRALTFVPAGPRSLHDSLRGLLPSFEFDSGIKVSLTASARMARGSAMSERALYRVAHEALTNAWRHAHCTFIEVRLECMPRQLALTVTDNGCGFGSGAIVGGHFGIAGLRRAVDEVGGTLETGNAEDWGAFVRATVPREPR
jgi:signal transduction histidine kinase